MTYAYECARSRMKHAQMKMRYEISKTSTTIKKKAESKKIRENHTQIACIVDVTYV